MSIFDKQSGATLVELLISIVIGLIIAASMMGMYLTSTTNSGHLLKTSKLNQELISLITVMENDIRRAGTTGPGGGSGDPDDHLVYPESSVFKILDIKNDGRCIIYSYDADLDGDITTSDGKNDIYGFSLGADGVVYMLQNHDEDNYIGDCTVTDEEWLPLTNKNVVTITNLDFKVQSNCQNVNVEEDLNFDLVVDEKDWEVGCDPAYTDVDDYLVYSKRVELILEGELTSDPSVKMSFSPINIHIRNNCIETTGGTPCDV